LHGFREDMMEPVDAQTASAEPDVVQDSVDALHDGIEDLKHKVVVVVAVSMSVLRWMVISSRRRVSVQFHG
jgi:hypothetical protein